MESDARSTGVQLKSAAKLTKFNLRKMWQNNLKIISKPHAYVQTIVKTPVKFQKN